MSATALPRPRGGLLLLALGLPALALAAFVVSGPLAALVRMPAAEGYDVGRMVLLYATLPRFAMAVLCGAALAASGAFMQQALRNPLASPTTLGVEAGGRLALALATLVAPGLFGWGRDLVTLAGCGAAALLVFALVRRRHFAAVSLILAGLVVGLYAGALSALLTLLNDRYLASLFIWGSGSLSQQGWDPFWALSARLALLVPPALLLIRPLGLLDLDDASARARGLDPARLRGLAVLLAVAISAFTVSAVGVIGFVGLVAPLLARLSGARSFGGRLALSVGLGAAILLLTDAALQAVPTPSGTFLPTGAVTAIIGAPLLLLLLPRLAAADRAPIPAEPAVRQKLGPPRPGRRILLALLLLAGLAAVALFVGPDPVTGRWGLLSPALFSEILPLRWPRMVGAGAAGAMLGTAGLLLQRLTGNEMASPEVLGVGAGAAFAAAVVLFLLAAPGPAAMGTAAVAGSLGVMAAVLAFGRRSGFQPERVLLAGIALNALLDAVVGLLSASGDPRALMLFGWMAGSTSGMTPAAALGAGATAATLVLLAALAARPLAILPLGTPVSRALGVPLGRTRLALFALAALLTAAATPIAGPLTFVGLMAPHLARLLGVRLPIPALAVSALSGGTLLILADWLGRTLAFPWTLPTGIVAALVGAPCLMLLLARGTHAR
ncbi:Fe(3+)-hydroxamate ABC transporter permease FhuB [Aureimonas flava]|uniref:Fe(3+)-hydroxamate ABC transporter permease FhuB n=1 Tax=Aureimonas flava TaxID=2320271 RepID=A0A3A1WNG2_9HYPH|nr:Fe(3+)-hydroxamate ABC transporter permease FhuB [Aureimonas flava]RIX98444.1 Fe(3+)-hydroxamate ABC transporter permease FhuB [Aureimonas flava]